MIIFNQVLMNSKYFTLFYYDSQEMGTLLQKVKQQ